jgi:IS5 family transposase
MTRWRERHHNAGLEELWARRSGPPARRFICGITERVNFDTTVTKKDIRFPQMPVCTTDEERLVEAARYGGSSSSRTYSRKGKMALRRQSGYARAQQFRMAQKQTRNLKTYLGRVARDIERKAGGAVDNGLRELLTLSHRFLDQERQDKNKLYSVHEPHVECISKGKIHKNYEFGCRWAWRLRKRNWAVASLAFSWEPV